MALAAAINVQPMKKIRTLQTVKLTIGFLAISSQPIAPRMPRNATSPVSGRRFAESWVRARGFGAPVSVRHFQLSFWHAAD